MRIYIFGNGNIPFATFVSKYLATLSNAVAADYEFIVCDYRGVDTLTMEYLKTKTANVTVFHVGTDPRYFPSKFRTKAATWATVAGFETDKERDEAAMERCTHFLAHDLNSDSGHKSGTQRNIERCLALGKERIGAL